MLTLLTCLRHAAEITSSIAAGSMPQRSTSALSTSPAMSAGCHPASLPPRRPLSFPQGFNDVSLSHGRLLLPVVPGSRLSHAPSPSALNQSAAPCSSVVLADKAEPRTLRDAPPVVRLPRGVPDRTAGQGAGRVASAAGDLAGPRVSQGLSTASCSRTAPTQSGKSGSSSARPPRIPIGASRCGTPCSRSSIPACVRFSTR